jgi:hypothetical protein
MNEAAKIVLFHRDLLELIKHYELDKVTNTPDCIIAEYLKNCLINFTGAIKKRDTHDRSL